MDNGEKTLLCVSIAGLLFMAAVFFDRRLLFIPAAVFDWLPLPTGWMKVPGVSRRDALLHVAATLAAYFFGVAWLLTGRMLLSFIFIETWWIAVMLGQLAIWRMKSR